MGKQGVGFERDRGFVYVVDNRRPQFSDERLLAALREFAARGQGLTRKAYHAWPEKPCAAGTIANRMGGWWKALRRAGVGGGRLADFEPQTLMHELRRVWKQLGRMPGVRTFTEHAEVSVGPYFRHWGSLRRACERLARFERGQISAVELMRAECTRKPIRPRTRWLVLERDGQKCRGCGRGAGEVKLEVDHIVPVSKGGSGAMSNLRAMCEGCNRGKGAG